MDQRFIPEADVQKYAQPISRNAKSLAEYIPNHLSTKEVSLTATKLFKNRIND
jgi:hypothetical protein